RLRQWLDYFSPPNLTQSNWNRFWIVNLAFRKAMGWDYSQDLLDEAWRRIDSYARDGGWMTDHAREGYFDDYNWWVFGSHELWWMQLDGPSDTARCDRVAARLRQRLEDYPYFFSGDGAYSEYGRSLSYKFARLGCPILAY